VEKESRAVEVVRSALIAYPAPDTFDLIEQAEHYPEFLPWCAGATILARDDSVVAARLAVDYRGLRFDLTTRNPKRRPHWLAVRLEEGPFRRFEGEWHVRELGPQACKIEFELHYQFDSTLVGKLADTVFGRIADTLVDAFAQRAADVMGRTRASAAQKPQPKPGETS
jgi:ribosome-associated toxin RatA of RatAB toxin-antitoxin module